MSFSARKTAVHGRPSAVPYQWRHLSSGGTSAPPVPFPPENPCPPPNVPIQILTAGGTIDKLYFDAKSEYEVGEPQIGEILREAGVTADYDVEVVLRKDSLEMTQLP